MFDVFLYNMWVCHIYNMQCKRYLKVFNILGRNHHRSWTCQNNKFCKNLCYMRLYSCDDFFRGSFLILNYWICRAGSPPERRCVYPSYSTIPGWSWTPVKPSLTTRLGTPMARTRPGTPTRSTGHRNITETNSLSISTNQRSQKYVMENTWLQRYKWI